MTGSFVDHLDVLAQFLCEAELLGEQVHDFVVGLALEQRLYDPLAPLHRAVATRCTEPCVSNWVAAGSR